MNKQKKLIKQIAQRHGVSVDEITRNIQAALDEAWNNPNPIIRDRQRELFPNGKPAAGEFIRVMAKQTKNTVRHR